MTTEANIVQQLLTDPNVSAVVGDRVYAELRTQADTVPAVTVELLSGTPANTLDGRPRVDRRILILTAYAKDRPTVKTLAYNVRDSLELTGHMLQEGPVDYDPDSKLWSISLEFSFWQGR